MNIWCKLLLLCGKLGAYLPMGGKAFLRVVNFIYSIFDSKNVNLPSAQTAESILQKYHEDVKSSAICSNEVVGDDIDLQIIVPAYNVEKYIDKCISSVLLQSTKYRYKLIIINDGSTDCTGELLSKYKQKEQVVIISQKNRGFSGARNSGLQKLYAKYLMFLDSDDTLVPGAIDGLMDMAYDYDADIVQGGFYQVQNNCIRKENIPIFDNNADGMQLAGFPWGKVYKASLFYNICLPEKYWFEDSLTKLIIVPKAKRVCTLNKPVYKYLYNPNGITNTYYGKLKSIDTFYVTRSLLGDAKQLGLFSENKGYYQRQLSKQIRINAIRTFVLGEEISKSIFILTKILLESLFDPSDYALLRRSKILNAILSNNYLLYRRLCCLYLD